MKNYSNDNPCVEKFPMHVLETLAIVLNQLVWLPVTHLTSILVMDAI